MTTPALLRNELAELRRARGAAALDGKPFDASRLTAIEAELAAAEDAEAESARRSHHAHEQTEDNWHSDLLARVDTLSAERTEALGRAEKACRDMAAAIKDFKDATKSLLTVSGRLGASAPLQFDVSPTERMLGRLIAGVLRTVSRSGAGFGDIKWFTIPPEASGSWTDLDRAATGPIIKLLKATSRSKHDEYIRQTVA